MTTLSDETSLTLLKQLAAGDEPAWRMADLLYRRIIYHWCLSFDVAPADAEELASETLAKAYRKLDTFEKLSEEDSFRGWLYTIARNLMRDRAKHEQRRVAPSVGGTDFRMVIEQLEGRADAGVGCGLQVEKVMLIELICEILEAPEANASPTAATGDDLRQHVRAYVDRAVYDLPRRAVAEVTGLPIGYVHVYVSRVERRLQRALTNEVLFARFRSGLNNRDGSD